MIKYTEQKPCHHRAYDYDFNLRNLKYKKNLLIFNMSTISC